MHPDEPVLARALGGRAWTYAVGSAAALGLTAGFALFVDAGWGLAQSLLGAVTMAGLLVAAGLLVQHRVRRPDSP